MSAFGIARHAFAATVLFALSLIGAQPSMAMEDGPMVSNAWVRMAPATLKTHGGYMTIANHGGKADELVSASSANYEAVQIHISKIEDGVATMQHLESVEVPAGGKVEFKPGGLHLMLMKAKKPLEKGGTVPLTLTFRSGASVDVEAKVMAGMTDGGDMKEMDHSGHGGHKTH